MGSAGTSVEVGTTAEEVQKGTVGYLSTRSVGVSRYLPTVEVWIPAEPRLAWVAQSESLEGFGLATSTDCTIAARNAGS